MKGSVFKRCSCRDPGTRKLLHSKCPKLKGSKHGQWWFRYDAPRGANGARRQPMLGPYPTEKEAEAALAVELARVGGGGQDLDRSITLGTFLPAWMEAKTNLSDGTRESYEEAIRLYFIPALGHVRMVDLRDRHIVDLVREMAKLNTPAATAGKPSEMMRRLLEVRADRPTAKPLSSARIKRILAVLSSALNYAKRSSKLITHNPAEHVSAPRGRKTRCVIWTPGREAVWREAYESGLVEAAARRKATGKVHPTGLDVWRSTPRPSRVMVWGAMQTGMFLDHATDSRLYALYHLVAFRGLRRGEVVGVAWSEVDLDEAVLTVRDLLDEDLDPDDPKSEAGVRTISLDSETVKVLRAWRKRQSEERLRAGELWVNTGLVFTREDGSKLRDEGVSQQFETLARGAGLPPIRFHDLRHGAATLALAADIPMKVVSELLGHSKSSFTSDVYTSVLPEVRQAAADAVAAIVPRRSRTSS